MTTLRLKEFPLVSVLLLLFLFLHSSCSTRTSYSLIDFVI
jgi:hypothetical protein